MKSKLYLITLLIIVMVIAGCAASTSNEVTTTAAPNTETEDVEKDKPIEVDKGLFNVKVTLPASIFEGENMDDVVTQAKEDGVSEITVNDDGSITYKMSKS